MEDIPIIYESVTIKGLNRKGEYYSYTIKKNYFKQVHIMQAGKTSYNPTQPDFLMVITTQDNKNIEIYFNSKDDAEIERAKFI